MRTTLSHLLVAILVSAATYLVLHTTPPGRGPESSAAAAPPSPAAPAVPALPEPVREPLEVSPDERVNIDVYQRANRSVVNITTHSVQADDFFFGTPREGSGSGSVLDKQGHVLTNFHVIDGARRIAITLFDSSTHEAQLVGADPSNDLAVLKIDAPADKLFPLPWGDSNRLQVGMRVFAIGNPFGLERTLTLGIVSSLNRSLRTDNNRLVRGVIQTDAAINPGNSGGPLLNRRGELVGITTAIVARASQSSGIGLAIPSNSARRIVDELIRFGKVLRPDCGLGTVLHVDGGLLIASLVPDGAAQKAGLRGPKVVVVRRGGFEYRGVDRSQADLITAVDGRPVRTGDDLLSYVETKKAGDRVVFSIIREGQKLDVPVELEQPKD